MPTQLVSSVYSFRENLVKAFALGEVLSSLASVTPEQERERVFEGTDIRYERNAG